MGARDGRLAKEAVLVKTRKAGGRQMEEQANWSGGPPRNLLLSGDVHSNPGPAYMDHPCVACSSEVRVLGIQCDLCS